MAKLVRATRPGGPADDGPLSAVAPAPLLMQAYRGVFPEAVIPPPPPGMSVLCSPEGLKGGNGQCRVR